jgi:hypothetical protein
LAQLEQSAAVVADDQIDSAAADTQTAAVEQEASEALYPDEEPREAPADDDAGAGDDAGEAGDGEAQEEAAEEEQQDDLPPIAPPTSWKAEEKEAFAKLPREMQETVTRREAERDRYVQTKAQEAAQVRTQLQQEALGTIQQLQQAQAAQLQQFAAQFEVQRPSPRLMAEDPDAYADQMEAYEYYTAQRQQAQQQSQYAAQQAQQAQQQLAALEAQQTHAVLSEQFPEFLDEAEGPKLREELGSIALKAGFPVESIAQANAQEILFLKRHRELEQENDQLRKQVDSFNKRTMAAVREAKKLPPLARPGAASGGARQPTNDPLKLLYPND